MFIITQFILSFLIIFLDQLMAFDRRKAINEMFDDLTADLRQVIFTRRKYSDVKWDHQGFEAELAHHIGAHFGPVQFIFFPPFNIVADHFHQEFILVFPEPLVGPEMKFFKIIQHHRVHIAELFDDPFHGDEDLMHGIRRVLSGIQGNPIQCL